MGALRAQAVPLPGSRCSCTFVHTRFEPRHPTFLLAHAELGSLERTNSELALRSEFVLNMQATIDLEALERACMVRFLPQPWHPSSAAADCSSTVTRRSSTDFPYFPGGSRSCAARRVAAEQQRTARAIICPDA